MRWTWLTWALIIVGVYQVVVGTYTNDDSNLIMGALLLIMARLEMIADG